MIHATVPPSTTMSCRLPALPLAHLHWQVFERREPFTALGRTYTEDLLRSQGVAVDEQSFVGGRVTFAEMISEMLPALAPYDDRFDLALLAHATPDAEPGRPTSRLAAAVPDAGPVFGISEQGITAPFTALRLAGRRIVVPGSRRALVVIADQSILFHRLPVPEQLRARHDAAVLLVLDESGRLGSLTADQHPGVAPEQVSSLLEQWLIPAPGSPHRPLVIAGSGVTDHWNVSTTDVDLVRAPAGMPCVGVWSTLAGLMPELRRTGRTVVLTDYEERLGYLGLCRIEVTAAGPDTAP
ncbi:hypothetical protein [Nocardia asteroides]|uniref:hypothetical protein n=1 Tax=Nocardia asteroides TaxID=1824 RepID=UPI001E642B56|nr:hypothetical protein [Nocardia asteroides]UGT61029.1 hypothetical protein LTT61_28460 [Nocardia asteroides]